MIPHVYVDMHIDTNIHVTRKYRLCPGCYYGQMCLCPNPRDGRRGSLPSWRSHRCCFRCSITARSVREPEGWLDNCMILSTNDHNCWQRRGTQDNLTSLLIAVQCRINAANSTGCRQLSPPVSSHKTTKPSRFSGFLKPVFLPCIGCVFLLLKAICLLLYPCNILGVSAQNS